MKDIHTYQPEIPPVEDGYPRPLWSVMIPTYHCAGYLRETLASVLAQDPGPDRMQIEVVDDHSTQDDPAAVVEELGRGRVGFYRQPRNAGHIQNFNTCLQRSRGRLIHLLHGDDYVLEGFYRKMQGAFEAHPEVGAAFCRFSFIQEQNNWQSTWPLEQPESGVLVNWLENIAVGQRLQAPAMVVRREAYERLGGFDRRIKYYGEDWEMWVRIAAVFPVWYEPEPLAVYRIRSSSLSGHSVRTGENIRDIRRVIEIIEAYLPEDKSARLKHQAREACGLAALRRARRMLDAGEMVGPLAQIREAVKCSQSWKVLYGAAFLMAYLPLKMYQWKRLPG